MRAELKFLFSVDADPLENYRPCGPFGLYVEAFVGPLGERGEESFGFMVCTPDWLSSNKLPDRTSAVMGRHFIFVNEFDYSVLEKFVRDYCHSCEGKTWAEVGEKVARLGHWEFEDYQPYKPKSLVEAFRAWVRQA